MLEEHRHAYDSIRQEPVLAALRRPPNLRPKNRDDRIARFQSKAEELRTIAEDVILNETRSTLLKLADSYQRMAALLTDQTGPGQ